MVTDLNTLRVIPVDIWIQIFLQLNVGDLSAISLCCHYFYTIQDSAAIWKPKCFKLWKDKMIRKELYHFSNCNLIHQQLSVKEFKRILELRGVVTTQLIEKNELVDWLIRTTPHAMPTLQCNKRKISYISSKVDSTRTTITKKELCDIQWEFRYHSSIFNSFPPSYGQFYDDNTYETETFSERYCWRFVPTGIQMETFPVLEGTRTENWSWQFENALGILSQVGFLEE
jgi:hypothetical protein